MAKSKPKESYRLGEQVLRDKLALEGAMDGSNEGDLRDRVENLDDKLGSKAWAQELKEYKHLSKEKAKVDREKAKKLKK